MKPRGKKATVRLEAIARDARELAKLERALDRRLVRASLAGYSLRELEAATGIPRATLARRLRAAIEGELGDEAAIEAAEKGAQR